ncbi:MAG: DNA polymerase III subunit delta' [Rubrivivax sp.]
MVVGESGALPLPWIEPALRQALAAQRGHALLLHASPGLGALELAATLAQAWLCEAPGGPGTPVAAPAPCGRCAACRLVQASTHPDLRLLLPEEVALAHGLPVELDERRKPSRQIRMDDVRAALDWCVTTSGRGRGKVLVVHPATALNAVSASALLKTLEEPPEGVRILLTAGDPTRLLPTLLSRCQRLRLHAPEPAQAVAWLQAQAVPDAPVLLAASGGLPLEAWRLHESGIGARQWESLPQGIQRGDPSCVEGWGVPRVVDALLKLCHDAGARRVGGVPRYFPASCLPLVDGLGALVAWQARLLALAAHAEHPWNEPLLLEALVLQGQAALAA